MKTNAIFCWILSEISSSGKKRRRCEQKIHTIAISLQPERYQNINVICKYGIESNQQARVDCGDHLSGT